ncbi:DUF4403 family protein [Belliella sp. DSM 107340]|uniref:DUF4403 family protein n=1 Tax=Belliella calami TaxID=2923436 RepID=A0ABS9UMF9_9BACT|nr:DUF4403 family protein [Belliella calami]MCH7397819.1 DUF4403 family protein [Belliella calami]
MKITSRVLIFLLIVSACKSINPNKPTYSGEPVVLPRATSEINIPIEIPFAMIEDNLNKALGQKLFAEKGLDLGSGFFTDIDVNRTGMIKLSTLDSKKMSIKIPMKMTGDLKFEKRIFGQNVNTAIPFDETLTPEISFRPKVGQNWDFSLEDINIENYGRSMKYNLLGFEIDLDPMIRKQLQGVLNNQLSTSNLSRLDFKEIAQEAWDNFSKPIEIDQDGVKAFVYTKPTKLKIREEVTADQKLRFFMGIEGEVYSQVGKTPQTIKTPLPNISYNESSENKLDIIIPLAITYEELDQYLNENLAGKRFKTDKRTELEVSNLESQSFGDRTLLKMDFLAIRKGRKQITGQMYLVGKPKYDAATESIRFDEIEFDINTKNILARSATWMKQGQVITQIKKLASYPIGEYLAEARRELRLQGQLRTEFADFSLVNPQLDVEGIYNTEEDIRIYLRSTGKMNVRVRGL